MHYQYLRKRETKEGQEREREREIEKEIDKQTARPAGRQTDRQTDRQKEIDIERGRAVALLNHMNLFTF